MNYFTKEWYELCQKTSAHLCLEEDEKAEIFSEEYFHQLYNRKLKEWLDLQEKVISKTEAEKETNEPFDREKISKNFHKAFIS